MCIYHNIILYFGLLSSIFFFSPSPPPPKYLSRHDDPLYLSQRLICIYIFDTFYTTQRACVCVLASFEWAGGEKNRLIVLYECVYVLLLYTRYDIMCTVKKMYYGSCRSKLSNLRVILYIPSTPGHQVDIYILYRVCRECTVDQIFLNNLRLQDFLCFLHVNE